MKRWQSVIEFIALAIIWGGSFLWMRVAAPEFGPVWLIELRLLLASMVLVPLMLRQGLGPLGLTYWRPLLVVGVLNSALPFVLLAYATLTLSAGLTSILNATAPLFGTAIALIWIKERHSIAQLTGLGLGFLGVVVLLGWQPTLGTGNFGLAVTTGLCAACCYAIAAPYVRHHLAGVPALCIAAGSLAAAALLLLPLLPFTIPSAIPSGQSLLAVIALGLLSTALAYLMYFRLIAHLGSTRSLTVGYLIPLFAIVWGVLWLGETVTASMGLGGGLVLLGTAIANRPGPSQTTAILMSQADTPDPEA